eukprot:3031540-Prymnesium_polylepis.2
MRHLLCTACSAPSQRWANTLRAAPARARSCLALHTPGLAKTRCGSCVVRRQRVCQSASTSSARIARDPSASSTAAHAHTFAGVCSPAVSDASPASDARGAAAGAVGAVGRPAGDGIGSGKSDGRAAAGGSASGGLAPGAGNGGGSNSSAWTGMESSDESIPR